MTSPASIIKTNVPVLTFGRSTYTANPSFAFTIGTQTLTPGGAITVSGTPIFEPSSGGVAVVGSSTQRFSTAVITPADILSAGGVTFTANPTRFEMTGTTVNPGGPSVTVSGTPVSSGTGGTVVMGTSTIVLQSSSGSGVVDFEGRGGQE